jgi:hypothetical protein
MTHQIKLTYVNIADEQLPLKASVIVNCIEGNPRYPDPPTPLPEIRHTIKAFQDSLSMSTIDKRENPTRDKLCKQIKHKLHELAAYVISKAENDLDALLSSGFDITMPRTRRMTGGIHIKYGDQSGGMISIMRGIRRARAYWHQYTQVPVTDNSVWTEVVSKSSRHMHTGLKRGVEYAFRVKIFTKEGNEIYSNILLRMVI